MAPAEAMPAEAAMAVAARAVAAFAVEGWFGVGAKAPFTVEAVAAPAEAEAFVAAAIATMAIAAQIEARPLAAPLAIAHCIDMLHYFFHFRLRRIVCDASPISKTLFVKRQFWPMAR